MTHAIDDAVVTLPAELSNGLTLLLARILQVKEGTDIRCALYGIATPAFGTVRETTTEDIAIAVAKVHADTPITAARDVTKLLPRINARTPCCPSCGELPLSVVGGRVQTLDAGKTCPFCAKDLVTPVPMLLRRLSWLTGELVPPNRLADTSRFPGERIPLFGKELTEWVGGLHLSLERALRDAEIPLYALLAHANLERHLLPSGNLAVLRSAAGALCQEPRRFQMNLDATELARAARVLLESKEIVNVTPETKPADGWRFTLGGDTYLMEGLIGEGESSHVYRAMREGPFPLRTIIKISSVRPDAFVREVQTLNRLAKSPARGTPYFASRLLPEIIFHTFDVDLPGGDSNAVLAYRDRNLFDWTLEDVIREYPEGVEPQAMIWMWNRILTFLTWLHATGTMHGAIVPEHVLLQIPTHSGLLLDWTYASVPGQKLADLRDGASYRLNGIASTENDIAMSARCMIKVLGGDPASDELPDSIPRPIAEFLRAQAGHDPQRRQLDNAMQVEKTFGRITETVYGPRIFRPFAIPRPSR